MINVAIIEDHPDILQHWRDWLNEADGFCCVAAAASTAQAVQVLPKVNQSIDVVLTDISLGENDSGINAMHQLRPMLPKSTLFMMFTIHEDDDTLLEAIKAGATGYILKNTKPRKVLKAIKKIHEGGSPMSPGIARKIMLLLHNPDMPKLDEIEYEVIKRLAGGKLYKEIKTEINASSLSKVKKIIRGIYLKIGVNNRTEAANWFRGRG